ncbi:MAG: glycosyltransferase [Anaerolineae bacterium]|nr:MAG: glycosyltransferase [Anaerolineae bacterium]
MTAHLSLILPAYRAAALLEKHVPAAQAYLSGLPIASEIIVVDDGSPDDGATRRAAEALGVRYMANPRNLGKGAAVRAGMLAASGRVRLYTDADLPFELESIEKFYWYAAHKEYPLVIGDRTLPGANYFDGIPRLRQWGSKLFSGFVGRFFVGGLYDTQCGFKAFRAEAAEDLFRVARINRFAADVELLYIALKRNYDIKRLPVRLRVWEESGVRILRDGLAMLRDVAFIRYNYYRGAYRPVVPVPLVLDTYPGALPPSGNHD